MGLDSGMIYSPPPGYPEVRWEEVFVFHPVKVETVSGKGEWVIFEKVFRGRVPAGYAQDGYYRYRRLKDHFILELKGSD